MPGGWREQQQQGGWWRRGRGGWSGYRRGVSRRNACGEETTGGWAGSLPCLRAGERDNNLTTGRLVAGGQGCMLFHAPTALVSGLSCPATTNPPAVAAPPTRPGPSMPSPAPLASPPPAFLLLLSCCPSTPLLYNVAPAAPPALLSPTPPASVAPPIRSKTREALPNHLLSLHHKYSSC